jgi:hypothetical protein
MNGLSAAGLADLAGVTEAEVQRLVDLGVLVARDGTEPFLETDVAKVRLAVACERAGLPMAGIAAAIRQGRLSFGFLEAAPYRRWAVRSARTYRQVSQETGVPLELLGSFLEAMGFARMALMSRCGGRAGGRAGAAARPLQGHPGSGLVDPAGPRRRRGHAPDRQRREGGPAGATHRAHAGGRRRPADRQGAGRPAER